MTSLSIVIPTRDRAETLGAAIQSALANSSPVIEIVVSDNASSAATREVVKGFSDPRLHYVNTGRRLSMRDNWEFAFGHTAGRYVMFIGDDDAVVSHGVDLLLRAISEDRADVYMWPKPVYVWPIEGRPAFLESTAVVGEAKWVNIRERAIRAISWGSWGHYALPTMYHSAVLRDIPERIRLSTGRVFHATQPDVFMAFAIPVFVEKALDLGHPVTIHGRSAKSNGGVNYVSTAAAWERFIAEYQGYSFHPTLSAAVQPGVNLTPDTILVAKDLFPQLYRDVPFSYEAMWACLCREADSFKWDLSIRSVWRMRKDIARCHPFRPHSFAAFAVLHRGIGVTRSILLRWRRDDPLPAPSDIASYAAQLSNTAATGSWDPANASNHR